MLDFKQINYNESAESEPEPSSSTGLSVVAAVNDTLERSPTNVLSQHINAIAQDYLHSYTNNQDEMPENVKGEFKNGAPKYIIDASSEIAEQKKVNDYFNDDQYIKFLNICESYGFKVNRNAPWQLIADLENDQMRKYAAAEGIDTRQNGLFNNLY